MDMEQKIPDWFSNNILFNYKVQKVDKDET